MVREASAGIPPAAASLLQRRVALRPTWLPVMGESMGRTIRGGSDVLVAAAEEPRFGEVWAFCNAAGVLVVHRFARCRQGEYYFQGDAHWPDPPVPRAWLVGRVLRVRSGGRERSLGGRDRLVGGLRLLLRRNARALARRLGLRRVRDSAMVFIHRR